MKQRSIDLEPLVGTIAGFVRPRRAKADHPVVVAVIAANATVDAALIAAAGAVAVALIAGGTAIAVTVLGGGEGGGDGDGEEGEGGDRREVGPGPGGSQRTMAIGASDLPPLVRGYINRDIDAWASSLPAPSGNGDQEVTAAANYRFDGFISRFSPDTKRFNLRDNVTLRFKISNVAKATGAPLIFKVDQLRLSTVNSPDTSGYSSVEFTAVQEGNVLWRWSARVKQGEAPTIDGPAGSSATVVRNENDLLFVRDLEVPIKYKAPGANRTTVVDVLMNVEGQGART